MVISLPYFHVISYQVDSKVTINNKNALISEAVAMKEKARAPYSGYRVGAAVALHDGSFVTGCNVEVSNYSLTCCAERVALFTAIAQGRTSFTAIAVATDNGGTPCGSCRQVIFELCGDIPVFITDGDGNTVEYTSGALLPNAFTEKDLPQK